MVSLELSAGSTVESIIIQLIELIQMQTEQDFESKLRGFADQYYWALEFGGTAEEFASKFDMVSPPEQYTSLCNILNFWNGPYCFNC